MCLGPSGGDGLGTMLNERATSQVTPQSKRTLDLQLLEKGGMSISEPDGGDVGLVDIITRRTR
jgi:hypothetical protein